MARMKKTVVECDNPNCDNMQIVEPGEPVIGYSFGKGALHTFGGGGMIPATFACSEDCIIPAVRANIEEAWHGKRA